MILGKVVGTVWATRKDEQLVGMKLQIVKEVDLDYRLTDTFVVAVDSVGAGVGEIVLVAQGSSGRQTELTHNKPVDAVIMAIVDKLDIDAAADAPAAEAAPQATDAAADDDGVQPAPSRGPRPKARTNA